MISMTVADIMVPAPIVAELPGTRNEVINLMVRKGLTGMPVVRSSDGKLMGVVSRRDVFRKFDEDQLSLIMKKGCITTTPDTSIVEVARIFSSKRIHRLPVVEDGKLVGIITPTDLLKIVMEMKTNLLAGDVIRTTCVTAYEGDPMSYAVSAMRISDVAALPILDAQGKLVGIITDRDMFSDQVKDDSALKELGLSDIADLEGARNVLPLFFATTDKYKADMSQIKDHMVSNPTSVFKKTNLTEVAKIMISNDYGQIPVRGTKDELIGMIYDVDVLCAITGNIND